MKGLDLAKAYAERRVAPLLASRFPALFPRVAVGLVGEGSECFGFDDELSRDHDWDPFPCLWLTPDDFARSGDELAEALGELPSPQDLAGLPAPPRTDAAAGRRGAFEIGAFFARFTGLAVPPRSPAEWRAIPETNLAVCTNGAVFRDPLGAFTAHREALLAFYPEDVRLKKIAARCARMAQSGQYNIPRSLERGETVAARCALGIFLGDALSLLFLLNRRYRPFYKWAHRAAAALPLLGAEIHALTAELAEAPAADGPPLVEAICARFAAALRDERLSDASGDFLLPHAASVQSRIADPALRALHVMAE